MADRLEIDALVTGEKTGNEPDPKSLGPLRYLTRFLTLGAEDAQTQKHWLLQGDVFVRRGHGNARAVLGKTLTHPQKCPPMLSPPPPREWLATRPTSNG